MDCIGGKMEQQIKQLRAVLEALETLTLTGSKNCGTYYNCMHVLANTIQELQNINDEQVQCNTSQTDPQ